MNFMMNDEIEIKSTAMKLNMKRFTMQRIELFSYYGDRKASIKFIDNREHVWHVVDKCNQIVTFTAASNEEVDWLRSVSHRKTTTDLHERFRATLEEGLDYAICFDWLSRSCKSRDMNGILKNSTDLSLAKLSTHVANEPCIFEKFFTAIDTPESIAIQYDLHSRGDAQC